MWCGETKWKIDSNIKGEIDSEIGGESERRGWSLKHRGRVAESEWERLRVHMGTTYLAEVESVVKRLKNKLNSTMRQVNSIKKCSGTHK